jgi:hypothetical protein
LTETCDGGGDVCARDDAGIIESPAGRCVVATSAAAEPDRPLISAPDADWLATDPSNDLAR